MQAKDYINTHIKAGYDLVFGEDHASITTTMGLMRDAVAANPGGVKAVVLELSPYIQDELSRAGQGEITQDQFILQARLSSEQQYLDLAGTLLTADRISEDQYSQYEEHISGRIESIIARDFGAYSREDFERDQGAFGAVYELAVTAAKNGVPVIANNHGRERGVLSDLNDLTSEDWIQYTSDKADFADLAKTIDINAPGALLVHRGAHHSLNIDGARDGHGFDDLLENSGRKVRAIGVYDSPQTLRETRNLLLDNGFQIGDPSDALIIGGELSAGNEIDGLQPAAAPPAPAALLGMKSKF